MIGYAEAPQDWGRTRRVAELLGVDLPRAVLDGWLSRREISDIVSACTACPQKAACDAWLSSARATPCLPVFCPNRQGIAALSTRI